VRDHQGERNEKEYEGNQPEDDVSRSGFRGGAEEIQDDDEEDLRHDQVEQAEFFAEFGAMSLDFGFGGL
jgi:hypothetical protein